MNTNKIDVHQAIANIFNRLKEEPLQIYTEPDLQSLIFMELMKFDDVLYETSIEINNRGFKTNRVHREYPFFKKGKADIVVFDKNDIININSKLGYLQVNLKGNGYRYVNCTDYIEVKRLFYDVLDKDYRKGCFDDLDKLRYRFKMSNNKPQLHFILYIFWDALNERSEKFPDFKQFLIDLFIESNKEPKIQLYIFLWPQNNWKNVFQGKVLNNYLEFPNVYITFSD